jgi:serine/threonine protein kinase
MIIHLLYKFVFKGDQINWNKDRPLGEGNFGIVYKGVWTRSNGEWDEVAVKMLKDFNDPASEDEIQRELNIMKRLNHENVVRIRGVLPNDGIIVMEFVREGSLDNYLRTHKDHIRFPVQLFIFADNICEGMDYLCRQGIIHRDLAARNILVANDEQVKISDFGLARQPMEKDYYMMTSHTNIPVKWMAFESLSHRIFHTPSDVWSFGVVLWEMFAFGESPYLEGCEDYFKADRPDEKLVTDMHHWMQKLQEGARLPKPEQCPSVLYSEVMLPCWEFDPKHRPMFSEIKHLLDRVEKRVT